ncbi:MAG: 2-oxoglutarate dehydrogenase, E2 component, dihydrolipoamide succinyltransferase [Terracidiphilus sp.]
MPTDVVMPQMGESIFEGTITKWLKKAGDVVQKDEPLFEISTDKVDAEIPSPVAGVLSEIKVAEGATVQINTVVAVVSESGGAASETRASAPSKVAQESAVQAGAPTPSPKKSQPPPAKPVPAAVPQSSEPSAEFATSASSGTSVVMPQMGESIFEGTITKWLKKAGEAVQKDEPLFEISTDKVDAEIPSPVAGTLTEIKVPEGETVQINTVVAVIGGAPTSTVESAPIAASKAAAWQPAAVRPLKPASAAAAEPPASSAEASAGQRLRSSPLVRRIARDNNLDIAQIAGTGSSGRITKEDILRHLSENEPGRAASIEGEVPAPQAPLPGRPAPLSRMRAIIAQRMVESVKISPHVHTVFKIDMTRIARLREREKAGFEQANGVKLTYMPFIAAAAVEALRRFPIVNASLEKSGEKDGENLAIRYHQNINLGIAVALEWGLIVPVIKQAEERSFLGLARAIADLAERARTKKLMPDEVAGNTFTLTNSGIFGEEFGMPIINQPDSAIMAIGALKKEPVVLTDGEGNDTIAIRSMQHFCLGFDHRIIDGADAGRFMGEFKKTLEGWDKDIG